MKFLSKYWGLIIILAFSFLILSRIFHPGFFAVHDDTQPTRIYEMSKSLKDGLFPVRWVNDLGFGYGYPIFNFYAPLPYYIGSFFNLIGFGAITSAKIMFSIAVLAAGIGMYLFIKSFLGELPAITSSVIYLFFPYFAINIFIRGAVGEYYAYSLLPFIFWGVFKIYYSYQKSPHSLLKNIVTKRTPPLDKGGLGGILSLRTILFSSFVLAVLIISHNLSAYMIILVLLFFFIGVLLIGKNRKILFLNYSLILLIAFFLSAFYTIPAIFEMNYTDVNSQLSGNFKYSNHFVCPAQWWDSPWGFAGSAEGCIDGISFRLGKTNIIFGFLGIFLGFYFIFIKKKFKYSFLFIFLFIVLIFSLFMMTEYSQLIWKILPKIEFIQFPWRFLNFTGFSLAVIIGFSIFYLKEFNRKITIFTFLFIIVSTIWLNFKLFTPQKYYNLFDAYYTREAQINYTISKITSEYMPVGFQKPKNKNHIPASPFEIEKGQGNLKILENKTGVLRSEVIMRTDGQVRINKAYFPAWRLFVDNEEVAINKIPQGMSFNIPKGNHNINLIFKQTPIEKIADILTLTGSMILIIGIIKSRKIFNHGKKTT